jgi:hypothetical protein
LDTKGVTERQRHLPEQPGDDDRRSERRVSKNRKKNIKARPTTEDYGYGSDRSFDGAPSDISMASSIVCDNAELMQNSMGSGEPLVKNGIHNLEGGLALLAAEPVPMLHESPDPSASQIQDSSSNSLPPSIYGKLHIPESLPSGLGGGHRSKTAKTTKSRFKKTADTISISTHLDGRTRANLSCERCRGRKIKCNDKRPFCDPCESRNAERIYPPNNKDRERSMCDKPGATGLCIEDCN